MRRIPALLAVVGLSALALTGCSAGAASEDACERPDATGGVLDLIEVAGADGLPSVELAAPVYVDATVFGDVESGGGAVVTSDAQEVLFSVAISNGASGESIVQGSTYLNSVAFWAETYPGLADMLRCASEGSRIVGAVPYSGFSPEVAASFGLVEGESAVIAIDLQTVLLAAADGVPQNVGSSNLPAVVLAPDGRPGIIVPSSSPPADLVVEVLKKGDGPVVEDDSTVRVHYTGVTWADEEVFDSSWDSGSSAAFSLDQVVPGFAEALRGQTVGSQVLAVIPPELGYQDQDRPSIPAGSTLVFVIDILGIEEP